MIENLQLSELLRKSVNNIYENKDKKSLTEILNSFRQISEEYNDFNNSFIKEQNYSSYIFDECTEDEQLNFYIEQLEQIKCLVINSIYEHVGMIWNFKDIYDLMHSDSYKNVEKIRRKVLYSSYLNNRPTGETSYNSWCGFQTIDLDIKDENLAEQLKIKIFDELKQFHWFLGVCKSASGKGLHIWTKINPISNELKNKKIEYLCNFRHKYSYIYVVLSKYTKELGYNKENILSYLDMAMSKPQQGSFISSDDKALLNTNFINLRLDVGFESAFNNGIESIDWISHEDLKQIFAKLDWFNNDGYNDEVNVDLSNISNINDRDLSKSMGRKHYKHAQRWQIANTLCSIYGYDKALSLMKEICLGTSYRELAGDVKTASIHNKPISIWAIKELNKYHGFNLQFENSSQYSEELKKIENEIKENENKNENAVDPIKILNDKTKHIELHLSHKQYLSDLKDDIISNLGKITLLEAGAGYGKTEMIKSFKAKTLLILPFTSTIKAKVESSETTKDWLYYYGSKKPTLDDLFSGKNMSMTIDKFSKLNVMELDQANFEYIVIDESHLLFTSSYREVMSPCISRLANCKAKIIMMTGTPTGELLFFPNIKHIKVIKEDLRDKIFECHLCPTKNEQLLEMCKSIANDIINNKKILYPTNKGNLYYEQVIGLIQQFLDEKHYNKQLRAFYYKKSNTGDESMDNINIDKSIGDNDIIFCTTYLSVGVDICDRYIFSIYFNETWIPQDIEQFANRLRNNDLYIKMFLPKKDSSGIPINYLYADPLDLSLDKKDILFCRDMIKTCNDMLERNQEESKYSPFISSILGQNRCLKYDENDVKYYIDETTYKLRVFEERYSAYSKQLPVLLKGIRYYGYIVEIIDHTEEIPEANVEFIEEFLKSCRHLRYNYVKNETFEFLDHLNDGNIDYYKNLIRGDYDTFVSKANKYEEDRKNNGLYCKDIEILEKNIPIVLSLYKFYTCEVIKEIFEYCVDVKQNKINYTKLDRIRRFVNIENNRKKLRLDFPVIKFISEAKQFAISNPKCKKEKIDEWLAKWSTKLANSIPDLVVEDTQYLESIFELIKDLWNVVIVQNRPKNGEITIKPFELLWESKTTLNDIYGGSQLTKDFFLQDLINNIKTEDRDDIIENEEELPELPHTNKLKLSDIEDDIPNIIHKEFDYDIYSKLDGSNDRFIRKQINTNSLRDTIFGGLQEASEEENIQITKNNNDLFESIEGNIPF